MSLVNGVVNCPALEAREMVFVCTICCFVVVVGIFVSAKLIVDFVVVLHLLPSSTVVPTKAEAEFIFISAAAIAIVVGALWLVELAVRQGVTAVLLVLVAIVRELLVEVLMVCVFVLVVVVVVVVLMARLDLPAGLPFVLSPADSCFVAICCCTVYSFNGVWFFGDFYFTKITNFPKQNQNQFFTQKTNK